MAGSVLQNPFAKQPIQQSLNPSGNVERKQIQSTIIPPEDNLETDPNKKVINKGDESKDPMMDFSKLWENPPEDSEHPKTPEDTSFLPKIDPAKIAETLGKIDFSKASTSEELTAIAAGGENATKAHISVLNKSLRQAMMTMFNVSQRMIESGLTNAEGKF